MTSCNSVCVLKILMSAAASLVYVMEENAQTLPAAMCVPVQEATFPVPMAPDVWVSLTITTFLCHLALPHPPPPATQKLHIWLITSLPPLHLL